MARKTKKQISIETKIINWGRVTATFSLIAIGWLSGVLPATMNQVQASFAAANLIANHIGESDQTVLNKFSNLQLLNDQNQSKNQNSDQSDNQNQKPYELGLKQNGAQDLATLKKLYPTYFGWLADTDIIQLNTVTLKFNQAGYVKGQIFPINIPGYVLYFHNGYAPDYNNEEYLNAHSYRPTEFQFHGKKGETKTFYLYLSKPLSPLFAKFLDINFIPEQNDQDQGNDNNGNNNQGKNNSGH